MSEGWPDIVKNTSILFLAKSMLLNTLWRSSGAQLTKMTVKVLILLLRSIILKLTFRNCELLFFLLSLSQIHVLILYKWRTDVAY